MHTPIRLSLAAVLVCAFLGVADVLAQTAYDTAAEAGQLAAPQQTPPQSEGQPQPSATPPANVPMGQVTSVPSANPPSTTTTPVQESPLGPPFQLDTVEQGFVDQILQMWENSSSQVKTFDCKFERWEYDPVFGPGTEIPFIKSIGQLTYAKPDKGSFKIDEIQRFIPKDPNKPTEGDYQLQKEEVGEHWVCDGKAIYEYKHDKKQLVVQPLPEEMRGQSIVDGPLPFLFGAEAQKLKSRYWIRSRESKPETIWLEAYPRTQADAANYHHVDVMLERKTMMPTAIQVYMPNGRNRAVYMFIQPKVNAALNHLFGALFSSPRTPLGWTRVVEELPSAAQSAQAGETTLK